MPEAAPLPGRKLNRPPRCAAFPPSHGCSANSTCPKRLHSKAERRASRLLTSQELALTQGKQPPCKLDRPLSLGRTRYWYEVSGLPYRRDVRRCVLILKHLTTNPQYGA